MLIHKGKKLEEGVRKVDPNVSSVGRKVGYTRVQVYNHFKEENVSDDIIRKYAEALNYAFKEEFPDLYTKWVVEEPDTTFILNPTEAELRSDVERYRSLYIKTLEEKHELLKENISLKEQLRVKVSQ